MVKGKKQSNKFANDIFNFLFLSLLALTLVVQIFMPAFVSVIAPGFIGDTEKMKISSYLLPMEITSLIERLDAYIEKPELPSPQTRRDLPWPLV